MKLQYIFLVLLFALFSDITFAQGKYAGTKKSLIGKTYTDSHSIEGLEGWQFREGSVITAMDDPEMITVDVFQKGTTCVVFFSIKEDTADTDFTILDVLEIKGVTKSQYVKTAFCREDKIENAEIVALIKPIHAEYVRALKAWRFNRDKRRIEIKNVSRIDCLNEGFDQS